MSGTKTNTLREQYEADGFLIHEQPLIDEDLVKRASEGMDMLRRGDYGTARPPQPSSWEPNDDPNKLCKIEQPQFANKAIWELVSHTNIGKVAAEITGAEMIQVWWVQLLIKPPQDGEGKVQANIGWHQDRNYWRSWEEGSELFTAWVAVSDVTADTGPMNFLRGSNHWGYMDEQSDFYGQDHKEQRGVIQVPEGQEWEEAPVILPPGGVSFHHCLTFHGSGPNLSGTHRRSFALHMRTENSKPVDDKREGLTSFIDQPDKCPVIWGSET